MGVKPRISPRIRQQAGEQVQQLTALDAMHLEAVLQTAIDKLAIIGLITVDPRAQALELTQHVGDEIGRMIDEQKALEARFQALVQQQPALRNMNNKAHLTANQEELAHVSEALRAATKQLCRNLKDNPNVSDNLAKVASERAALQALLSAVLGDVRSRGCAQPLVEAVLAADLGQQEMRHTIEAERAASAAVRQLKAELKEEKAEHEERMRSSRRAEVSLKDQLRGEKLSSAVDARYHEAGLSASNQAASRLEGTSLQDMAHELARLRQEISLEQAVTAATVEHLEAATERLQIAREGWEVRAEDDSRDKERETEALIQQRNREAEALRRLEAEFNEQLAGRQAREAARRAEIDAAAAAVVLAQRRERAAQVIQGYWRGYQARALLKGGGKKDKKGGKKGGAKEGKGKGKAKK